MTSCPSYVLGGSGWDIDISGRPCWHCFLLQHFGKILSRLRLWKGFEQALGRALGEYWRCASHRECVMGYLQWQTRTIHVDWDLSLLISFNFSHLLKFRTEEVAFTKNTSLEKTTTTKNTFAKVFLKGSCVWPWQKAHLPEEEKPMSHSSLIQLSPGFHSALDQSHSG